MESIALRVIYFSLSCVNKALDEAMIYFLRNRRPTALQDRTRDSDDDDYQDRDYDVAALANNLSQAFHYGIYSNDMEEVCCTIMLMICLSFSFNSFEFVSCSVFIIMGPGEMVIAVGQVWLLLIAFYLALTSCSRSTPPVRLKEQKLKSKGEMCSHLSSEYISDFFIFI